MDTIRNKMEKLNLNEMELNNIKVNVKFPDGTE